MDKLTLQCMLDSYDLLDSTNTYYHKYVALVLDNLDKPKQYYTHKHHVVPLAFYANKNKVLHKKQFTRRQLLAWAAKDPANFCVNLTKTLHVVAHCYLLLASKQAWFSITNKEAIKLLGYSPTNPEQLVTVLLQFAAYDELLQKYRLPKKQKHQESSVVKFVWMHSNTKKAKVPVTEVLDRLKAGWDIGMGISTYARHKFKVHNAGEELEVRVQKAELISLLEQGYIYGGKGKP